jgi:hypothetical protein
MLPQTNAAPLPNEKQDMLYTQHKELCDAILTSNPSDEGFISMLDRYRASGGIASGTELAERKTQCEDSGLAALAKLILSGEVFSFEWRGNFWIPLFQFNSHDLSTRHCVGQVLRELSNVFDGWTLAVWFIQANAWIEHKKPIDLLDSDLPKVIHAARADRYVALG